MRTALVSPVRQCEILTHKKIGATAFVLEAMELGKNDQALEDHRMEPCFREAEVVEARKTRRDPRRWRRRKDRNVRRPPVNQTVRANRVYLQRETPARFRHHHPRDTARVGIRVNPDSVERGQVYGFGGRGISFDAITNLRELHLPLRSRGSDPATNHQTMGSVAVCDWRAGVNRP